MQIAGTIALVGSGEFLPPMAPVDRVLLETLGDAPRVAIVPTAAAPDGDEVFERWLNLGVAHFEGLGAEVEPVALRTGADADDPALAKRLAQATFVYLSGGKPSYLRDTFAGSACWQAIVEVVSRGGVLAGCSAGAMVLGESILGFRRLREPSPGLGLVPGIVVIPHFDEFPVNLAALFVHVPRSCVVAGIDGMTALVGRNGEWSVVGRGGVTIFDGIKRIRYGAGQTVPLRAAKGT